MYIRRYTPIGVYLGYKPVGVQADYSRMISVYIFEILKIQMPLLGIEPGSSGWKLTDVPLYQDYINIAIVYNYFILFNS